MSYTTEAANRVAEFDTYRIATGAEAQASNIEAIAFFENIRDNLAEAIDYAEGERPDEDALHEIADGAPNVYNHTCMMELIGTLAYLDECELGDEHASVLDFAGHVLYQLAGLAVTWMLEQVDL